MVRVGHHQHRIRRLLIKNRGHATTVELLRACYGPRKRRFTLAQRWAMQQAARRWARSVAYGRWEALPPLLALLGKQPES